jgi:hypothetical protein
MGLPCDYYFKGRKLTYNQFKAELKNLPMSEIEEIFPSIKDEGISRLSWTTGEQQNDRYDLSKTVNRVTSRSGKDVKYVDIEAKSGSISLTVSSDGKVIESETEESFGQDSFVGNNLSDIIGKEVADKIMSSDKVDLSGDGLKVGGKGMKGFYGSPNVRKPILFEDANGNKIVFEKGDYRISVDNDNNAKKAVLWHKEIVNGKEYWAKRGVLNANISESRFSEEGDKDFQKYLKISEVEIEKEHRGNRLGQELYKALIDYAGSDVKALISYTPSRVNKREVPNIWKRLGARQMKDNADYQVIDLNKQTNLGILGNVAKSLFKQDVGTTILSIDKRSLKYGIFDANGKLLDETNNEETAKKMVSNIKGAVLYKEQNLSTQHSIDITPELKAQVSEGLPMFMVRQNETEATKSEIENAISSLDVAVSDYANDDSIDNYLGLNDAFETLAYTSIGDAQSMAKELGAKYPELKDDFDSILNEASKPKVESKKVSNESDAIRTLISEDVDGRLYPTIVDSLGKFANQITAETTGNVQEREVSGEYVRLTLQNMKDIATQKMLQLQEVLGEDWVEKSISFFEREPYSGNPAIIIGLSNIISTDIQNKIQSTTDIKELDSLVALQNRMDRVVNRNGRVASLALNYRRIFTSFAQGDSVTDAMAGNNLTEEAKKQIEVVKKALVEQPTDEQLNSVGNVVPPSSQKTKGAKSSRKTQTDSVLKAQIKNNAINSLTEVDANGKKSTKTWQDAVREANEESKKHKC